MIKTVAGGKPDTILMRSAGVQCMPIDIETGKPRLVLPPGNGTLTGPYLLNAGLLEVANAARLTEIPIIGNGGVYSGKDVIMYIMAGACALEIMTSVMRKGPGIVEKICSEIEQYMVSNGLKSLEEIRGLTLKYLPPEPYTRGKIK